MRDVPFAKGGVARRRATRAATGPRTGRPNHAGPCVRPHSQVPRGFRRYLKKRSTRAALE